MLVGVCGRVPGLPLLLLPAAAGPGLGALPPATGRHRRQHRHSPHRHRRRTWHHHTGDRPTTGDHGDEPTLAAARPPTHTRGCRH